MFRGRKPRHWRIDKQPVAGVRQRLRSQKQDGEEREATFYNEPVRQLYFRVLLIASPANGVTPSEYRNAGITRNQ